MPGAARDRGSLAALGIFAREADPPGAREALRLPVVTARQLLVTGVEGLAVLHAYVRGTVAALMQRIACNRAHGNEQRCACWLLRTADRVGEAACLAPAEGRTTSAVPTSG